MRAAIVCALMSLAAATPAQADFVAARPSRQAGKELVGGGALIAVGAVNATASLISFSLLVFLGTCPGNYSGPNGIAGIGGCINGLEAGSAGLASGLVALPTLAVGITLQRAGDNDAFAAAQSLPPGFFVERAHRRRRLGIALTLAGVALTAAGIGFGGGAWEANTNYRDRSLFPALVSVASITGVAGVALLSVGATLATLGK